MFLGAIPRRPEKAEAYKELRKNLTMLGVCIVVIRAIPYAMHLISKHNKDREIKLDF
ncbi:hypothetical protein KP509_38G011000 [Ceratopteris richardii]|uniref:Uncharacterized protein n=1 Tax=Ceratopteris richardii TaxID=49495 RepID=A0A8T2Q1U4_CERRI|nr:hypothetical protein KP509_38G011000 [Ceratopteris richardii]